MNANAETIRAAVQGRIFSARFIKRDGTVRTIVCRTGVTKGLKVVDDTSHNATSHNATSHNDTHITVWEMSKGEYRTIPVAMLLSVTLRGVTYTFDRPTLSVVKRGEEIVATFGDVESVVRVKSARDIRVNKGVEAFVSRYDVVSQAARVAGFVSRAARRPVGG